MRSIFRNEQTLIKGLIVGEEDAYVYLVDLYHHQLCAYANSLIRDDLAAEDIVQNVFVMIWKKRHLLNEGIRLRSYIYKCVYNEFIDQRRKKNRVLALEEKYVRALDAMLENEDEYSLEKSMKYVEACIDDLPPQCKRIFILSKKEGLKNKEIAKYLNLSVKTVEGHLTRAFIILRKKLGPRVNY